jgi:ATP-dependent HslUV protease ATP-binding subunit HslU
VENLTPREVVAALDKYVVGQAAAKRALAVALRNRFRRRQLPEEVGREILPKNILMIGPTGVGKTELARRLARLMDAPFVKVEATRFTEVGYVGRDVESIVHEVAEAAVGMVNEAKLKVVQEKAETAAVERLIGYLAQQTSSRPRRRARAKAAQAQAGTSSPAAPADAPREDARPLSRVVSGPTRDLIARSLADKELEETMIEIELADDPFFDAGYGFDSYDDFGPPYEGPSQRRIRRVSVKEARRLLTRDEANKLIDWDQVAEEGIQRAEQLAVVFIDEIDKVVGPKVEVGADVSGAGVQRDLLPIVEGTTVMTRFGPVKTDHILFIAAGAFSQSKPSDLIPELQGRFPLRVELASLSQADFERILVEPENALTKQSAALLSTEGVELSFSADGVRRLAEIAAHVNERNENIGARRLHTVLERTLEEISFSAPEHPGEKVVVDAAYVDARLGDLLKDEDLSRYIL